MPFCSFLVGCCLNEHGVESRPYRLNPSINAAGASIKVTATTLPRRAASESKQELGQFFTPRPVAEFMASLFESSNDEIRLLDAGAGDGALTEAFVRMTCSRPQRPSRLAVVAYELDARVLNGLQETLDRCESMCAARGIEFDGEIRHADFIESALEFVREDLFTSAKAPFNAALLNPPYRKINSDSHTRRLLREAGIETSNLYTGFLALAARLLCDGGEMVSITPRSFCNGPYFRPFRREFLGSMSLERLHVFDSRSAI
ncbi:MAG: Eco57I restriction-modification methylase domain-containing protein [Planctomycetaceae bacterium]